MAVFHTTILVLFSFSSLAAPQQPEINDQFKKTDLVTEIPESTVLAGKPTQQEHQPTKPVSIAEPAVKTIGDTALEIAHVEKDTKLAIPEVSFSVKVYNSISEPIIKVVNTPKVNEVIRNIGTCVVNGVMELFSYYLPAPLMPILAAAAGLIIPFEPVVMLREKMPVTSYRRAFQTAMSTFLRTFEKYKVGEEYDPYMTRRFNRRFMNDDPHDKKEAARTPEPADT